MRSSGKTILIPVFLVIIGLTLVAIAIFAFSQPDSNTSQSSPTVTIPPFISEPYYPEIVRVSLDDAKAAYDASQATFLDVRSESSYRASHISGSINIPLPELETRYTELDPEEWIITYCT